MPSLYQNSFIVLHNSSADLPQVLSWKKALEMAAGNEGGTFNSIKFRKVADTYMMLKRSKEELSMLKVEMASVVTDIEKQMQLLYQAAACLPHWNAY